MSQYAQAGEYVELASWIFWILFSITLHELGHGWMALRQGDDTPVRLGHMTANPLVHMGLPSLVMFGLCGIAWGQMPVNPYHFKDGRKGDILVSAAGPAMNVLIALACLLLLTAWVRFVPRDLALHHNGAVFLFYGMALNLILVPFNLLPVPPLDGAHILAGFSRRVRALYGHPEASVIGLLLFLAVFNMSPIGGIFVGLGWRGAESLADRAGAVAGNPAISDVIFGELESDSRLLERLEGPGGPPLEDPGVQDDPEPPEPGD